MLVNKAEIAQISLNWSLKIAGCSFLQGNPFHCSNLHHSLFLLLSSGALWCKWWSISSPIVFILNRIYVFWIRSFSRVMDWQFGWKFIWSFAVVRSTLQSRKEKINARWVLGQNIWSKRKEEKFAFNWWGSRGYKLEYQIGLDRRRSKVWDSSRETSFRVKEICADFNVFPDVSSITLEIAFKSRRLFLRALVSMDGWRRRRKVWEKSCHSKCFNSKSAVRTLISVAISLRVLSLLSRGFWWV